MLLHIPNSFEFSVASTWLKQAECPVLCQVTFCARCLWLQALVFCHVSNFPGAMPNLHTVEQIPTAVRSEATETVGLDIPGGRYGGHVASIGYPPVLKMGMSNGYS